MNVLQLIDSLDAGGAERMAVNIANGLVNCATSSHLCVTRKEGLLKATINSNVGFLYLKKRHAIDVSALLKLRGYVKNHQITIVHAHSSSFFLAIMLKVTMPKLKVIWHDHYGKSEQLQTRPKHVLKWCSYFFSKIFSVNDKLKNWSSQYLKCKNVYFLPNFATLDVEATQKTHLKGTRNKILCLANLRPQKDFENLLNAFKEIEAKHTEWSLHCVGKDFKDDYSKRIKALVKSLNLDNRVFFYGSCSDIYPIITQCRIGVLASKSEGLPLALLEYGLGGLAVIATDVGDCSLVIKHKQNGILVPPKDSKALGNALKNMLTQDSHRNQLAERLKNDIKENYSEDAFFKGLLHHYSELTNT